MSTMMDSRTMHGLADVVENIETGRFDGDLELVEDAVRSRKAKLEGSWRENIAVGWRVRIGQSASPRYWRGHTGTVVRVGSGVNCIKVELDDSVYRRNGRIPAGTRIDCRRSLLEPISE